MTNGVLFIDLFYGTLLNLLSVYCCKYVNGLPTKSHKMYIVNEKTFQNSILLPILSEDILSINGLKLSNHFTRNVMITGGYYFKFAVASNSDHDQKFNKIYLLHFE